MILINSVVLSLNAGVIAIILEKSYLVFLPEILIGFLVIFLIFLKILKVENYKLFIFFFFLVNAICLLFLFSKPGTNNSSVFLHFGHMYSNDFFSNMCKSVLIILVSCVLLFSLIREKIETTLYQKTSSKNVEYIILLALGTLLFLTIITSHDLFLTYISLEGLSLLVTIFIIGYGPIFKSTEAAIKYFSISAFTSGFVLYGISSIYKKIQTTNFTEIKKYTVICLEQNQTAEIIWLVVTLVFIMVGFFFKLTVAPFHMWASEVYGNIPMITATIIFLPYKFSLIIAFFKIVVQAFYWLNWVWGPILLILSMSCIIWGSLGALYEDKIKKFMVFASINQTGFILLGLGSSSIYGLSAALMHLFFYFFSAAGLFLFFVIIRSYNTNLKLSYIHQLQYLHIPKIYSIGLIPLIFSMMGFPPFMGFFTKYFLLVETLQAPGLVFMGVVLFLNIVSSFYYFRLLKNLFFFSNYSVSKLTAFKKVQSITFFVFFVIILFLTTGWVYLTEIITIFDSLGANLAYPFFTQSTSF